MHLYAATPSMHVPWFRHGLDAHSLILVWQLGPRERGTAVMGVQSPQGLWRGALCGAEPAAPAVSTSGCCAQLCAAPLEGPLTTEAFAAGAHVATGHVSAGAAVDTGVGLTLVVVDTTVCPTPPGVTLTFVPAEVTVWFRSGPRCVGLGWGFPALPPSCGLRV